MLQDQGDELALATIPGLAIVRELSGQISNGGALRLWLAYVAGAGSRLAGFLITESDDVNELIAFCPISADLIVGSSLWRFEIQRQWRLAKVVLAEAEAERADVIWLRGTGKDLQEVPVWLYSLACIPISENWDGHLYHPQPFCPSLFGSMARQPAASRWILQHSGTLNSH
jgi:hypothetical protein